MLFVNVCLLSKSKLKLKSKLENKSEIENRFRFPIGDNRIANRIRKSKSIGNSGIDENRHPVSIISLLVRGTRLGNHNLHLMGGICISVNVRFRKLHTDKT